MRPASSNGETRSQNAQTAQEKFAVAGQHVEYLHTGVEMAESRRYFGQAGGEKCDRQSRNEALDTPVLELPKCQKAP
jgi:hypothetical protein